MAFTVFFNTFRPYFKRKGLDTVDAGFYDLINVWESWYKADVPGFHNVVEDVGRGETVTRRLRSLDMAPTLCKDVADMLVNEKLGITIAGDANQAFVDSVLQAANFAEKGNEYQERKAATGTAAYVPYLADAVVDEDGNVISGTVKINYASATGIFPTAWSNGKITEVVFAFPATYKGKKYYLMQHHALERTADGHQYVIDNSVIDRGGKDVPRSIWEKIPAFRGIPPRVETGSAEPQFAIDKLAIVNSKAKDETNPMGEAIFADGINLLAKLDMENDSYYSEFELGTKRIFVAPEMLVDEKGHAVFPARRRIFYKLPEDYMKDTGKAIEESNMEIRAEEHERAINQDLNLLSLKVGFGTQYYRFDKGSIATATQVISENSDLYRTIKKHEIPLEATLKTLIRAILRLGIAAGNEGLDPEAEIKIDFDDSIIEDKASEREEDRKDVAMGAMGLVEYRAKWYNETKEEAAANLPDPVEGSGVLM